MADSLARLNRLAQMSPSLIAKPGGTFQINGRTSVLPRYVFLGARSRSFWQRPKPPPQYQQERALVAAMQTILAEYQKLMAYAPNL